MPEASECRLMTEYLNKLLKNKCIRSWTFLSGQYDNKNKSPKGFEDFEKNLPLLVESVKCKGKFIYFTLYNEYNNFYILHSLRMTGRWQNYYDKYCKWVLVLDDDEKLWFRNPRCLATLEFSTSKQVLDDYIQNLGPDILTPSFSLKKWRELCYKYSKKNITAFLMNQSVISGCGNYIKAEALYYAGISPLRKVGSLTDVESEKLYEGVRIIPRLSYNANGVSIKDYADENGCKGGFVLKVYGHKKAKRTKTADGRTTYWFPSKQK